MAEEIPPAEMPQIEPLSVLWRVLSAPQTLLLLLGLMALALILATWVPQIPPQAMNNPQAWLATQPGVLAQGSGLVRALGLYDLYHALWFRVLLTLLGLAVLVRTVEAGEQAWRSTARQARSGVSWTAPVFQVRIVSALPVDELRSRLQVFLAAGKYRWQEAPQTPGVVLTASRRPLALWMRLVGSCALLVALVGLFVAGSWGWQSELIQLLPGESRPIGHGTPYALRLSAFHMQTDTTGRLATYGSQVDWLLGQEVIEHDLAEVGRPARLSGIGLHQVGYLPVVEVRGRDGEGSAQPLHGEGGDPGAEEATIRFSSADDRPLVPLPQRDQFLALSFEPIGAAGRPVVHLALVGGGTAGERRVGSLSESGQVTIGGLQLDVGLAFVPLLRLDFRPAMGLTLGSAALALLALAASWAVPARMLSLAILPGRVGEVQVEVSTPTGVGQREWLVALGGELREVLGDGA